jgi:hypothetical protein
LICRTFFNDGQRARLRPRWAVKLAAFPDSTSSILGYSVSAGERLSGTEIPEVNMHIQKQTVQARERKMRALWTLEAAQDLKAYHNLDMEAELTDLLSKEMNLEIDRELIEDIRMIAYGAGAIGDKFGGWYLAIALPRRRG